MIPTNCLFNDLFAERWGDPRNPGAAHALPEIPANSGGPWPRFRARRPNAWSLTIPIDRRLR